MNQNYLFIFGILCGIILVLLIYLIRNLFTLKNQTMSLSLNTCSKDQVSDLVCELYQKMECDKCSCKNKPTSFIKTIDSPYNDSDEKYSYVKTNCKYQNMVMTFGRNDFCNFCFARDSMHFEDIAIDRFVRKKMQRLFG